MDQQHLPIFVYGTLQRGEERHPLWPRPPRRIETAATRGRLYDLGPYPALAAGEDLVEGELWHLHPADMAITLQTLDAVEGYRQGGPDWYQRQVVRCRTLGGELPAYAYCYARLDDLPSARRIMADPDGFCRWRSRLTGTESSR